MVKKVLTGRTFEFARQVVKLCQVLERTPGVSRTPDHQLPRSGTSVGANVEEGQAAQSRADFLNKLLNRPTGGPRNALLVVDEARLSELLDEADQLIAILTTITKKTKQNSE